MWCRAGRSIAGGWVALLFLMLLGGRLPAQQPTEYQLKAVFLFNFAQFVEWPPDTFAAAGDSLTIGVLGEDPFGHYLDDIVRGELVDGHPLAVRRYSRVEEIAGCQILFIGRMGDGELQRALTQLKTRPVLTVGDAEGFARHGGMIRFVTDHSRIRLRINLSVAEAANLRLSSKLLRPAEIVTGGTE